MTESRNAELPNEQSDPLNPRTFLEPKDAERSDHAEDDIDSVVKLPSAPPHPWKKTRKRIVKGQVKLHRLYSKILENERRIWVYPPPGYKPSSDLYRLLIILDGRFFTKAVGTPHMLDNLRVDNQIPPMVAVMVDNPGHTWAQSMEIREKELSCYGPFSEFITQEMVPWLHKEYHITTNPTKVFLVGGSAGGLAAAFTALKYPDTINVIAMSGSFWWKPDDAVEWEWLSRQFVLNPRLPLRFYIEVGLLESKPTPTGFPGQVLSNRYLRNVLRAKGYDVYYDEQMHGHDSISFQGALAEGLIVLNR